ncbi:MAG: efflux RND transporter periplasmic adaptor subunit [Methylobacter sp.]|jgi:Cu(I)/Ag(I) efflux system membrane fusion protein|nr:efflux RND transporter periplasmic adaptor subunit [Methylobacter sp.]
MTKYFLASLILMLSVGLGFWVGRQEVPQNPNSIAVSERKLLYYRHPMNPKVTSPTPAKDDMGMDYLPVYAEDQSPPEAQSQQGKILYYRHPMGAADTSPVPKKDEMGMDYLPVYESELASAGQIQISPEKIQKLGVSTETVAKRALVRSIRALGSIQIDERRVHAVTPRFEGWIQRLYVNATGQVVKRGQSLLEVYSPELMTAQQEYLIARQGLQTLQQGSAQARGTAERLTDNALQRLHYWDIAPAQLQRLQSREKPSDTLPLLSPVNGVVLDKPALEGMRFMPGELLFRIADLNTVWLIIEVFEQDIGEVRLGQVARVHINAYPDRLFNGKVEFIYPTLTTETRTVKVRVELPNAEGLLKPGLYGSVTLAAQAGKEARLAIPDSAVIDSGARQVVLVQRGDGRFEPHTVKLGLQADGYREVLEGLEAGEDVVTRANFLIDAESNLKSALGGFANNGADTGQAMPEASGQPQQGGQ